MENLPFEWYLGFKYFISKKKEGLISVITAISILGVAVGVTALIVVLAVMNGFQHELRERIMGVTAHVTIRSFFGGISDYRNLEEVVKSIPKVKSVSPFIYLQALLSYEDRVSGAFIRGIDVPTVKTSPIAKNIVRGSIDSLVDGQGIILGIELARQLGVNVGDVVSLLVPSGRITPLGQMPKSRVYKVVGIFQSGMYEYDHTLAYIGLKDAQNMLGITDQVMGLEVWLENPELAPKVVNTIYSKIGNVYWIRDWMQLNKSLFSALKLEKTAMFVILTLIVFVAAFNIISSLIMLVLDKSADIAILKAMGATSVSIRKIFMIVGLLIGICGTLIGLIGGFGLCAVLEKYHFIDLPKDIYPISTLPVRIEPLDVVLICFCAILISFVATIYPSRQAAKLNPIEALRYE